MKTLNEQLTESMFLTTHAWRTELDRRLRPLGFSHSRWLLLLYLSRKDGCTQSELAQDMGIEPATLVRSVDHMEKQGLLQRCGSDSDRRVKHLHLTGTGKEAVTNIRSYTTELRKEMLAGLSQDEIKCALDVLNTIRGKLGAPT